MNKLEYCTLLANTSKQGHDRDTLNTFVTPLFKVPMLSLNSKQNALKVIF